MRVLLINPEFPDSSFWTMHELCRCAGAKALLPPLGLITVAALLPEDWELRLIDLNTRGISDTDWQWADMVMLTAMIVQQDNLAAIIAEAKRRKKTVVTGGPWASSMPDAVLDTGSDFVIRGEGETVVPMFLEALKNGVSGGVLESPERPDIALSPVPRFDLLDFDDYVALAIQASRGCPFDCEFCDIVNLYGHQTRYKTPDQITRELDALLKLGARGDVFICDDNFIGSRKRCRAILQDLIPWSKEHGEPFNFLTQVSVNLGNDLEMIDLMTQANFSLVFIGVETPDTEVLERNRKFQNVRNPLAESIESINRNGLSVIASFVLGFDGEKKGAGERICALAEETAVPTVMLNTLQAVPNTRLWDRLKAEGRLIETKTTGQSTGGMLNFVPTRPEPEIMEEFVEAWERLYDPSRFLQRTYRYYLNMRPQRKALGAEEDVGGPPPPVTWRSVLTKVRSFARLVRIYGLKPPAAGIFWKQLLGMRLKNPTRLVAYLNACALGSSMIALRSVIRTGVRSRYRDGDSTVSRGATQVAPTIST